MSNPRKIDLMHLTFGKCPGHTCVECSNLERIRYRGMNLRKCRVYGVTHSVASDWEIRYEACGAFNWEYDGRPIIELVRHGRTMKPVQEEPLDGQITMEVTP